MHRMIGSEPRLVLPCVTSSADNISCCQQGHVDRVRRSALKIATCERLTGTDLKVVELAALMHDVRDYKYSGNEIAGIEAARAFLTQHCVDPQIIDSVCYVIENVGFQKEKRAFGGKFPQGDAPLADEATALACVQDADRLDAIGAVGIARCLTFGGARHRALYDPDVPCSRNVAEPMLQEERALPLPCESREDNMLAMHILAAGVRYAK